MGKIIIANWKANPTTLEEAMDFFDFYLSEISKYPNIQLVICPPFVYIEEIAKRLAASHESAVFLGAQDIFWEESGPYTGEVSVGMLKNLNVKYVLIGHSDRRYKIGESDGVINKKVRASLGAGIVPVLLVGERDRSEDRRATMKRQLGSDLRSLTTAEVNKTLIVYEPVWAISTAPGAQADSPANVLEAVDAINRYLIPHFKIFAGDQRLLYGGSIGEKNVAEFLSHPEISGAVIGGASLRKEEFAEILKITAGLDLSPALL